MSLLSPRHSDSLLLYFAHWLKSPTITHAVPPQRRSFNAGYCLLNVVCTAGVNISNIIFPDSLPHDGTLFFMFRHRYSGSSPSLNIMAIEHRKFPFPPSASHS